MDDQNDWGDPASDDWGQGSEGHTEVEKDAVSSSSTDTESLEKPTDSSCTEDMETAAFARVSRNSRDGRFGSKVGQIGPKWDKSGAFPDFSAFGASCWSILRTILKM